VVRNNSRLAGLKRQIEEKIMGKKIKAKNLNDLQFIGTFFVDSGQAMIGDPCNLQKWSDSEEDDFETHVDKAGEYSYLGAANATLTKGFGTLGDHDATVFATGNGDGLYPVYAQIEEYDEWGPRIWAVVIDMSRDGRYVKDNSLSQIQSECDC
jgi:hypothetical protein